MAEVTEEQAENVFNTSNNCSDTYNYEISYYDNNYEYDESLLTGFTFEVPIYLYIWPVLVGLVSFVNVLVVSVLLRKSMRTSTNMILAAIAISDTLTGLVTLPTYIAVYWSYEQTASDRNYIDSLSTTTEPISSELTTSDPCNYATEEQYGNGPTTLAYHSSNDAYMYDDSFPLTKEMCTYFLISKHFLSKSFHTVSIFLTLFLGFQRFVSVSFPFRAQQYFTAKVTVAVCATIFVLSPSLHVYHLIRTASQEDGTCAWDLANCEEDCAYLWIIFCFRHLIPCSLLSVFTGLFIAQLRNGKLGENKEQSQKRIEENRRVSIIVTAIVILFLIPEIPYGLFLLVSVIWRHANLPSDLKTNRAIYAAYEVTLVISFHINFYIYTLLNKRFRLGLKHTFLSPIRRVFGRSPSWFPSRSSSSSKLRGTRPTIVTTAYRTNRNGSRQTSVRTVARTTDGSAGKQSRDDSSCGIEMAVLKESTSAISGSGVQL